ncbi:MAG TPA: MarR family winged helix-turn-helix transcriptional regulator [Jatrophihabitans sp.]|jgi:DNA-binding MarR family transcriptional regulator|uniref:MarR family winged helix-turn-helix transcriptional regulator n=1 Tax=Jatrophihabitans sp. TaxID=1932789 RepID=UPI002DFC5816|nr:MarR family winged helix-turn-helix transcriptional regulator [Jatrophihabitans sp.]
MTKRDTDLALTVLNAATLVVDGIQEGLARRGHAAVRPAQGFALVRIGQGDTTVLDVAEQLGVTKQAASQLVEVLVGRRHVKRVADPNDARRRLLTLTARGRACAAATEEAAAEAVAAWRPTLGAAGLKSLYGLLGALDRTGPLRPAW